MIDSINHHLFRALGWSLAKSQIAEPSPLLMTAANRNERIDSYQAEIETLLPRLVAHSPGDAVKILNDYPP